MVCLFSIVVSATDGAGIGKIFCAVRGFVVVSTESPPQLRHPDGTFLNDDKTLHLLLIGAIFCLDNCYFETISS